MGTFKKDKDFLILKTSLQGYFFDQLHEINRNSSSPLPHETIHYSSEVMGQFGDSGNFFENDEGKISEKILGIKLMEATHYSEAQAKRVLKDVGDTALFLCGYFAESLSRKILDFKYYQNIGKIAYNRLDSLIPSAYDREFFYKHLASNFENLTVMIKIVSVKSKKNQDFDPYLILPKEKKIN
ncbi:MAG: hypothetical protein DRQ88_06125 [Epsilonproteobacteria bacterium]|nr:MAG: hypothetical protein DRQ89_09460 [Campylobacterota bacterium]RLA66484.1 MAG: hypothetical protein DRQ88_06125 [Campylobacterota bacterium]